MFEKCVAIIADTLGIDESMITMDSDLVNELGADSLDVMQMLTTVEEQFALTITDEEILNLRTVGDVVRLIESK